VSPSSLQISLTRSKLALRLPFSIWEYVDGEMSNFRAMYFRLDLLGPAYFPQLGGRNYELPHDHLTFCIYCGGFPDDNHHLDLYKLFFWQLLLKSPDCYCNTLVRFFNPTLNLYPHYYH